MPRTAQQIQDEYAAKPALSKLGIAADDLVRIAAGGLTGGVLDRALGGNNVELTDEAKVRAGLAGDVANVGGMALGLKGASGIVSGARSIPTAIAAARSAGPAMGLRVLTNTAGPGLIPAAASVSKGALAKGAGLLAALGISVASRQDGGNASPVAPAATARMDGIQLDGGAGAGSVAPHDPTTQDKAMAAINSILSQPFTVKEFEAATGALPQVASVSTKVSNKDKVYSAASGISDTLYQAQLAQASKLTGDAKDAAVLKATETYRRNLLESIGVDPSKQALANAIAQQQEQ